MKEHAVEPTNSKCIVLLSGGMDSATLLYHAPTMGFEVVAAMGVDYGQRHGKELAYAAALAEGRGVRFEVANLAGLRRLLGGSSQTDDAVLVPLGHYADDTMKATVVPNRNMVMLSVAAGFAISQGAQVVLYAAHAGDHPIYPDCRPEFVGALGAALALCHYTPVRIAAPFAQDWTKGDIARRGQQLGVPFAQTWSCYQGAAQHCGRCGTCVERKEAFELSGVPDPTVYADAVP